MGEFLKVGLLRGHVTLEPIGQIEIQLRCGCISQWERVLSPQPSLSIRLSPPFPFLRSFWKQCHQRDLQLGACLDLNPSTSHDVRLSDHVPAAVGLPNGSLLHSLASLHAAGRLARRLLPPLGRVEHSPGSVCLHRGVNS